MALLWTVFFLTLTVGVFALPFLSSWEAFTKGADAAALPIDALDHGRAEYAAEQFVSQAKQWLNSPHQHSALQDLSATLATSDALIVSPTDIAQRLFSEAEIRLEAGAKALAIASESLVRLEHDTQVAQFCHGLHVLAACGCILGGATTAKHSIILDTGVRFKRLSAINVRMQEYTNNSINELTDDLLAQPYETIASRMPINRPHDAQTDKPIVHKSDWIVNASAEFDATHGKHHIVYGKLYLKRDCKITGSLKVMGDALLEPGSQVHGSLFCKGSITVGADCHISGVISALKDIHLGTRSSIGSPDNLVSVTAAQIFLHEGACVHGSVWAQEYGESLL
jgi:hypothetical protein